MTEQEELRLKKEKDAIKAMRGAASNMNTALNRITELERVIEQAVGDFEDMKAYIPEGVYGYKGETALRDMYAEKIEKLKSRL